MKNKKIILIVTISITIIAFLAIIICKKILFNNKNIDREKYMYETADYSCDVPIEWKENVKKYYKDIKFDVYQKYSFNFHRLNQVEHGAIEILYTFPNIEEYKKFNPPVGDYEIKKYEDSLTISLFKRLNYGLNTREYYDVYEYIKFLKEEHYMDCSKNK